MLRGLGHKDRAGPELEGLVSPWGLWVLFGLVEHHHLQWWMGKVLREQLRGDLWTVGGRGHLQSMGLTRKGTLPGLNEWDYCFHGIGCCLKHRVSEEEIDVDFLDNTTDWIRTWFYRGHLESLKKPRVVQRRIIELHPSIETIELAVEELERLQLIEWRLARDGYRVLPVVVEQLMPWVDAVQKHCRDGDVLTGFARAVGDWPLVAQQGVATAEVLAARERVWQRRREFLAETFGTRNWWLGIEAQADLTTVDRKAVIKLGLREFEGSATSLLMSIIEKDGEHDWSDGVIAVLRRTDMNGEMPQPAGWVKAAKYLLTRKHAVEEVKQGMLQMRARDMGAAAIVALEHVPEIAVEMFRRALRSSVPYDRSLAAAALAVLDEPWCRDELLAVLQESTDEYATAECRAALNAISDILSLTVVREWELTNLQEPEFGQPITVQRSMLEGVGDWLRVEMEQIVARVLPLRGVIPTRKPS
jgi:hypothetical protein